MRKIPLQAIPSQKVRVVLDGQNCTLSFYYRFGNLYADVLCNDGAVQIGAICCNRMNIIQVANTIFSGGLYFVDLLGDTHPQYSLLGKRYILLYVPESEELPRGLMS